MIIKNGNVFQEDGSYKVTDLYIENGRLVASEEEVTDKNVMVVDGYCPIHHKMQAQEIKDLMAEHPEAEVCVHPECNEAVVALADYIGSTSGIIKYATESPKKEFIIGTEMGVSYKLQSQNLSFGCLYIFCLRIRHRLNQNRISSTNHPLPAFFPCLG